MEIRSFPDQARKRKKESEPTTDDFYKIGKELQNRSGQNLAANASENRRFREFFGTGANVALIAWQLLVYYDLVPESGLILHMLWGMFFYESVSQTGTWLCCCWRIKWSYWREDLAEIFMAIYRCNCWTGAICGKRFCCYCITLIVIVIASSLIQ